MVSGPHYVALTVLKSMIAYNNSTVDETKIGMTEIINNINHAIYFSISALSK